MAKVRSFLKWIGNRLAERSSWLGVIAVLASLGISVSPELQDVIIQLGLSLAGLVAFLTKDKKAA